MIMILIILIILSSFFSATEIAFLSINRIRLKNLAEYSPKAKRALALLDNDDQLFSTILIGNNIVNISATAIATVLFMRIYGDYGVFISVVIMTLFILVFGEVTPKGIAKQSPEKFCLMMVGLIYFLKTVLAPINWLLTLWKKMIGKMFVITNEDSFTQEELLLIVEEAQHDGELEEHESDLISAAIEFNDLDVKEILTPRVEIVAVDVEMTVDEIEKIFIENNFSRLPVYENSIDNLIGVIHEKDFYVLYYKDPTQSIKTIIKNIQYTSPHVKVSHLLRQLQSSKTHMAVVIDEYGGTAGIITMEDILEELVGEIYDEHDDVIEYFMPLSEKSWQVQCDANLEDMFEYFKIEDAHDYDCISVGGWVIHELERIPDIGNSFCYNDLKIEVTSCDDRKVETIVITKMTDEVDTQ